MTVCSGFLPPPIGWVLYAGVLLFLGLFLIYCPFKKKLRTSIKIVSVISFVILLFILFFVFTFIVNDSCYYALKPKFVQDFNLQITSQEHAKQVFHGYFSQEFNRLRMRNTTLFDEQINLDLQRMTESEESYSVYFYRDIYILYKDGKLYKKWSGD